MSNCNICEAGVNRRAPGVLCSGCKKSYHGKCVNLNREQVCSVNDGDTVWKCEHCCGTKKKSKRKSLVPPQAAVSGESDSSSEVDYEDITESYTAVCKELRNISKVQKTFEKSLTTFSHLIDGFNKKMKLFETKAKEVDRISADNKVLRKELSDLQLYQRNNEQMFRVNDVEIVGVPQEDKENLITIVKSIGVALQVPFTERDIDTVHRVQCFDKKKIKNIIVKFQSRIIKNNIVAAARQFNRQNKEGFTTQEINLPGRSAVYVNEHLTPERKLLLINVKKYAKQHNIEFVWTKECRIYARRNSTSRIKLINCFEDIQKIDA